MINPIFLFSVLPHIRYDFFFWNIWHEPACIPQRFHCCTSTIKAIFLLEKIWEERKNKNSLNEWMSEHNKCKKRGEKKKLHNRSLTENCSTM